jgi:hypothetical protein
MAQYEAIKKANAAYVASFTKEKGELAMPPARKAAVVICMVRRVAERCAACAPLGAGACGASRAGARVGARSG